MGVTRVKDNVITQLDSNEIVIIENRHTGQHWGVVNRTWYGACTYGWVDADKRRCLYLAKVVSSVADVLKTAKIMMKYKDELLTNGVVKPVDFKTLSNG